METLPGRFPEDTDDRAERKSGASTAKGGRSTGERASTADGKATSDANRAHTAIGTGGFKSRPVTGKSIITGGKCGAASYRVREVTDRRTPDSRVATIHLGQASLLALESLSVRHLAAGIVSPNRRRSPLNGRCRSALGIGRIFSTIPNGFVPVYQLSHDELHQPLAAVLAAPLAGYGPGGWLVRCGLLSACSHSGPCISSGVSTPSELIMRRWSIASAIPPANFDASYRRPCPGPTRVVPTWPSSSAGTERPGTTRRARPELRGVLH